MELEFAFSWAALMEWVQFAVRWLHVMVGIAWIGSSFYFIALDLGLKPNGREAEGVKGEEWQVHGGGFYHIQKYNVAPPNLPKHLVWFIWESGWTWISGAMMLVLVYYFGAKITLIDPQVMDLKVWQAIAISAGSLVFGWMAYNQICKWMEGKSNTVLMLILFVLLVAMAWGYTQVFSGRAALLHLGAFTGTIMSANVFMIIIPNQRIVVADLQAGRTPDAKYGVIAKQRSTHNNYLTLPVLFLMLSNHYPLAFAAQLNWIIASLVFLMGVTIRHYFNEKDAGKQRPMWTLPATCVIFGPIVLLSLYRPADMPRPQDSLTMAQARENLRQVLPSHASSALFPQAVEIVQTYCAACHAAQPGWQGLHSPPKGVILDNEWDIANQATAIFVQAGHTRAMPPGNITGIRDDQRQLLREWYQSVR